MKMFDSVIIAYDQTTMDVGLAVRSGLELFRLHVYAHFCVQKRNVIDLLAGNVPGSQYVVLCSHGFDTQDTQKDEAQRMKLGFQVVDQIQGKWQSVWFTLSPENISNYVKFGDRTIIALGCGNGREPLAKAFLKTGCRAYIGPIGAVDQDSTALFALTFFYHLLSQERDPSLSCSEQEAVKRAAALDEKSKEGTHVFRYYSRNDFLRTPA